MLYITPGKVIRSAWNESTGWAEVMMAGGCIGNLVRLYTIVLVDRVVCVRSMRPSARDWFTQTSVTGLGLLVRVS